MSQIKFLFDKNSPSESVGVVDVDKVRISVVSWPTKSMDVFITYINNIVVESTTS